MNHFSKGEKQKYMKPPPSRWLYCIINAFIRHIIYIYVLYQYKYKYIYYTWTVYIYAISIVLCKALYVFPLEVWLPCIPNWVLHDGKERKQRLRARCTASRYISRIHLSLSSLLQSKLKRETGFIATQIKLTTKKLAYIWHTSSMPPQIMFFFVSKVPFRTRNSPFLVKPPGLLYSL